MKWLYLALSLGAVLLPCLPLLPVQRGFYADWANHLWLVSYFGDYYRAHGNMPTVINTPQIVGETVPIFYGYLFYPLMGWLSARVGPDLAVRLAAAGTLALQFFLAHRVLKSLGCARGVAMTVACLVTWATYSLTNLYNRSALTEFFAGAWLTCAACYWFLFLQAGTTRAMVAHGLGWALFCTLATGTHPISGWMGVCLFLTLTVAGLLAIRGEQLRRRIAILGLLGLGAVLCLAPWLYATARYSRHLLLATRDSRIGAISGIDQWYVRFFPLPLDARCLTQDPAGVSTPYLDAQLNVPLLVLTAVCVASVLAGALRRTRALDLVVIALTVVYAACCVILSLDPAVQARYLPKPFHMVQFTYRWVNQINLALLAVLCMALLVRARRSTGLPPLKVGGVLLGCVLTGAGSGLLVKLGHAYFISAIFYAPLGYRPSAELAPTYYGLSAYSTPLLYPAVPQGTPAVQGSLEVDPGRAYGTPQPLRVVAGQQTTFITSVLAFPWNRVYVDGQPVPPQDVRTVTTSLAKDSGFPKGGVLQAVPLAPGEHTVEYRFQPDRTWSVLALISKLTLAAMALGWVALSAHRFLVATGDSRPPLSLPPSASEPSSATEPNGERQPPVAA